jgi:hypothetical protein
MPCIISKFRACWWKAGQIIAVFLDEGLWDEMRVITNESISIEQGIPATYISSHSASGGYDIDSDHIAIYRNE